MSLDALFPETHMSDLVVTTSDARTIYYSRYSAALHSKKLRTVLTENKANITIPHTRDTLARAFQFYDGATVKKLNLRITDAVELLDYAIWAGSNNLERELLEAMAKQPHVEFVRYLDVKKHISVKVVVSNFWQECCTGVQEALVPTYHPSYWLLRMRNPVNRVCLTKYDMFQTIHPPENWRSPADPMVSKFTFGGTGLNTFTTFRNSIAPPAVAYVPATAKPRLLRGKRLRTIEEESEKSTGEQVDCDAPVAAIKVHDVAEVVVKL